MAFNLNTALSMFDPQNASAPLGSITRQVVSALPGGSTVLGAVGAYQTQEVTPPPAVRTQATPSPASTWSSLATRPGVILAGLGAVVVLVLALVLGRR